MGGSGRGISRRVRRAPPRAGASDRGEPVNPIASLLLVALLAALGAAAVRRRRTARARRAIAGLPGSSPETAIRIRDYGDMETAIASRVCLCGNRLDTAGEGSREIGDRRFRVSRLVCPACEEEQFVFFETTDVLH